MINYNADHFCDFTVSFIKMYAYEKIPPQKGMLNAYWIIVMEDYM